MELDRFWTYLDWFLAIFELIVDSIGVLRYHWIAQNGGLHKIAIKSIVDFVITVGWNPLELKVLIFGTSEIPW